jgi:hypothetical protein
MLVRCFFKGKVSRNSENAYQAPKLRAVFRQSPTPSTFPKERGGEKAYSTRRGSRRVDWYVFLETLGFRQVDFNDVALDVAIRYGGVYEFVAIFCSS